MSTTDYYEILKLSFPDIRKHIFPSSGIGYIPVDGNNVISVTIGYNYSNDNDTVFIVCIAYKVLKNTIVNNKFISATSFDTIDDVINNILTMRTEDKFKGG